MPAILSLTRDAARVNAVINHPDVRPYVGAPEAGYLDISRRMAEPENLFPFGEHGGFALIWTAPAEHEVHTYILPSGRGKWARQAAAEMISLAAQHGTERLWTQIEPEMRNVRNFAVSMGMVPTGETLVTLGEPHLVYEMGTC